MGGGELLVWRGYPFVWGVNRSYGLLFTDHDFHVQVGVSMADGGEGVKGVFVVFLTTEAQRAQSGDKRDQRRNLGARNIPGWAESG